jgi:hypothetical protein
MVRTIKHHIWKLCAPVQPSGHQPSGSGRSKPYCGNYVQPKCNRPDGPDARATLSGRGLVMEAFGAILKRRLQLTVRPLGQAVWTPSSILIITFWSNIRLGRNQRHWKANEKFCNLMVPTANRIIRTETSSVRTALRKFEKKIIIAFRTQKQLPFQTPKATIQTHVPETPILTRIMASKAYK